MVESETKEDQLLGLREQTWKAELKLAFNFNLELFLVFAKCRSEKKHLFGTVFKVVCHLAVKLLQLSKLLQFLQAGKNNLNQNLVYTANLRHFNCKTCTVYTLTEVIVYNCNTFYKSVNKSSDSRLPIGKRLLLKGVWSKL